MRGFRLTTRGRWFVGAAVLLFGVAAIGSAPALLYPTGLLLGLVILAVVFVAGGHSKVQVDRVFSPQVVDPGQVVRARLVVANAASMSRPEAQWVDHLPSVVAGRAEGLLPALGPVGTPDSKVSTTFTLQSSTRGHHPVGPLLIRLRDPFGLVERSRSFGDVHRLTVLPRRYRLDPIRPAGSHDDGATRPAPQHAGAGENDVIARPYTPGDAMKRLHWKATAHRGELMVRQEEQHLDPRAAVLIDLDAASQGTVQHRDSWEYSPGLEWAISAAASITTHLVQAGYVVVVGSDGGTVDGVVAEGHETIQDVMIQLAECEPTSGPIRFTADGEHVTFLVTGRLEADRAAGWIEATARGGAVHAVVSRSTRQAVLDQLLDADLRVTTYTPQADVPEVWAALDDRNAHAAR